MKEIIILDSKSEYKIKGQALQQDADLTYTGKIRKADKVPFDQGSDIPEFNISVKSNRFTLASNLNGETLAEKVADYFARTASTTALYITSERKGYEMTMSEFAEFVNEFTTLESASAKNGGGKVVRGKHESKAMLQWLASRAR